MVFVGCVQDSVEEVAMFAGDDKIFATISAFDSEERVQLDENQQTVWSAEDKIVVQSNAELAVYQFDGQTGDRGGSFTKMLDGGTLPDDYKFEGKYYALYPYEAWYSVAYFEGGIPAVLATIPPAQSYLPASYGLHTNLMLGASNDGRNYEFKNMLGYLCLNISGNKVVKSIEVKANNSDEYIAGTYFFAVIDINVFGCYAGGSDSITLDCGDGVQLSDTPTKFYLTMPPITLSNGFSVKVTFTDGDVFMQETNKEVVIKRNTILPMKTFNTVVNESEYDWIYIYHTGTTVAVPYVDAQGHINWGDGDMSSYSSLIAMQHDYRDGQTSHTITVKSQGATIFVMRNCKGVSKIDLSNF